MQNNHWNLAARPVGVIGVGGSQFYQPVLQLATLLRPGNLCPDAELPVIDLDRGIWVAAQVMEPRRVRVEPGIGCDDDVAAVVLEVAQRGGSHLARFAPGSRQE